MEACCYCLGYSALPAGSQLQSMLVCNHAWLPLAVSKPTSKSCKLTSERLSCRRAKYYGTDKEVEVPEHMNVIANGSNSQNQPAN